MEAMEAIKDQELDGAGVAIQDMHVVHPALEDFLVVQLVEVLVVPERPQDLVELVEDKISLIYCDHQENIRILIITKNCILTTISRCLIFFVKILSMYIHT